MKAHPVDTPKKRPEARPPARKSDLRKAAPAFKYKPRFGAIVECQDEAEQRRTYEKLTKGRLKVKLVRV